MKKVFLLTAIAVFCGTLVVKAQTVSIDNCDKLSGWSSAGNQISLDTKEFKEGKASLTSEGEKPYRFRKMFSSAVNLGTDGTSGFLSFDLFVADAEEIYIKPGFVTISSSIKAEENAHRWNFKDIELKNGWNKVVLELSHSSAKGGNFDGNLKYFAIVQRSEKPAIFKLDNIQFQKSIAK